MSRTDAISVLAFKDEPPDWSSVISLLSGQKGVGGGRVRNTSAGVTSIQSFAGPLLDTDILIFSAAAAVEAAALSKPNFCNSLMKPFISVSLILYGLWAGPGNEPFATSSLYSTRALLMTSPT